MFSKAAWPLRKGFVSCMSIHVRVFVCVRVHVCAGESEFELVSVSIHVCVRVCVC